MLCLENTGGSGVATLSVMALADGDSELAVMGLGALVMILNLCLYLGLPVLAGFLIREHAAAVSKRFRSLFRGNAPKIGHR